jgi:NAD(P)-dependent dehydrogenase (short-subunit alcohol dehydrogenase family)
MARALLAEGARVLVAGRDREKVEKAVGELGNLRGACHGAVIDVRSEESIRSGVTRMLELWDGIDVLVNNAGIGMRATNPRFLTDPRPFWEVSPEGFRNLIDTNLTGYFLMAREVVPHLLKSESGRIINIGVSYETMRRKGFAPYGPSRAATEALSRVMAEDLASTRVSVNELLPGGATDTGMIPDEVPDSMRMRLLSPDIMAEPVQFLCSDQASGVTGQRIVAREFAAWKDAWSSTAPR